MSNLFLHVLSKILYIHFFKSFKNLCFKSSVECKQLFCDSKIPKYGNSDQVGHPHFQYFLQSLFGAQAPVVNIIIITLNHLKQADQPQSNISTG